MEPFLIPDQVRTPWSGKTRHYHRVFDLLVSSPIKLASLAGADPAEATIEVTLGSWPAGNLGEPLVTRQGRLLAGDGVPKFILRCFAKAFALDVADFGTFVARGSQISCHLNPSGELAAFEFHLVSMIALWLEGAGIPVLHAAALTAGGKTVLVIARSGTGKSTLAAAFAARGWRVLSDDISPLRHTPLGWTILPGPHSVRLVEESSCFFSDPLPACVEPNPVTGKRHFQEGIAFEDGPASLDLIYIYQRAVQGAVGNSTATPLRPFEGLAELDRHAYAGSFARILAPAGRLNRLAAVLEDVPIRRLTCPDGLQNLDQLVTLVSLELALT